MSDTVNAAARDPEAVGLNAIAMVQLADAARLLPQLLLEIKKSPGLVPVTAMLLIVMEEPVPLLKVADCDVLLDPTMTLPNERDVGLMLTAPLIPNPVSVTVCGLELSESLKFSVAVRVPVVVGAKMMFTVQLVEAASVAPQVWL